MAIFLGIIGLLVMLVLMGMASAVENIPKACAYIYAVFFVIGFMVVENPGAYFLFPLIFVAGFLLLKLLAYVLTALEKNKEINRGVLTTFRQKISPDKASRDFFIAVNR